MTVDGSDCDWGYYCIGAAKNRRPTSENDHGGDRCKAGSWCGVGTTDSDGTFCLEGTYSSARGLREASECITCPNGFMCTAQGMVETNLDESQYQCDQGYYCEAGIDGLTTLTSNSNTITSHSSSQS